MRVLRFLPIAESELLHEVEYFVMQDHPLTIRDDGLTAVDPAGPRVHCAVDWIDEPGFEAFVAGRLMGVD